MQITSILDIVDGRLLNHPSISFIYSIKTNPKKVKEGDLFIVKDDEDIPKAIENGAFAIIVDKEVSISDNEIAWIFVESMNDAIVKLVRYLLSNKRLNAFYCNNVSYDLFKILLKTTVHTNIKIVPKELSKFFKLIDEIEENDTIISSDKNILDNIYPVNFNFNTKDYEIKNLIEHSIFETSFSFQERYFSKIKISSLYITEFLDVYSYLGFDADLNKLRKFHNLKPIFVDKLINHTDYGRSDKFLIAQNNDELILREVKYLEKKYNYAKVIYLTTNEIDDNRDIDYIFINSLCDLKEFLKKNTFNAVYFIGVSYDELYEQVSKEANEPSLL
ncbi:peptidoglycan synthetase [Arcobacter arenosus]|uniref:Peptidoglycan synthetase n=1 Tax=Arcobacter arenosus TaxID=2576037 RepID=A0A5R8XXL2_9BACT|nr:peptidoglycan synthetase [Arcobacter arenosus]TLP35825.1 peptidoglycan synthetase [Arcobacter arenosus]